MPDVPDVDLRPPVPWTQLLLNAFGGLHGVALLATAPWLFWRGFIVGGLIAVIGGVGVLAVFCRDLYRTGKRIGRRDAVGQARRARLEEFERELEALPVEKRGPHLADEIEAILDGKRP